MIYSRDFIFATRRIFFYNLYIKIIGDDFTFAFLCSRKFTQK